MTSRVLEKVGSSLATDVAVALTQEMVRIDSTNGEGSRADTIAMQ
jgi:hypothetical protein